MFHWIGQIIFGLIIGIIAKLVVPGPDPGGLVLTAIVGMVGAFLGGLVGRKLSDREGTVTHWVLSVLGAVVVLLLLRFLRH